MSRLSVPLAFRVAVLAVACGAASGVIGAAFTTAYLSDYAASLGQLGSPLRLAGSRPSPAAAVLAEIRERAFSASAQVYVAKTDIPDPLRADRQAVVLTSDGWLVAAEKNVSYATVVVARRSYPVLRSISDAASGAMFLKVDGRGLPTVGFGDAFALVPGDDAFVLDGREALRHARVISVGRPISYAADRLARRVMLDAPASSAGAPVFSNAGDLLGFAAVDGSLLPMNGILPGFRLLLKGEKISRPLMGVTGVDLARAVLSAATTSSAPDAGFRVTAVGKGSAAEAAGLRVGDVLLFVDGRPIDAAHPLDETLLAYAAGQSPVLSVLRNGSRTDVAVPLR